MSLGGVIFAGAYTWRGLFSEIYGISQRFRVQFFSLLVFLLVKFHQFKQLFVIRCFNFLFPHYFY